MLNTCKHLPLQHVYRENTKWSFYYLWWLHQYLAVQTVQYVCTEGFTSSLQTLEQSPPKCLQQSAVTQTMCQRPKHLCVYCPTQNQWLLSDGHLRTRAARQPLTLEHLPAGVVCVTKYICELTNRLTCMYACVRVCMRFVFLHSFALKVLVAVATGCNLCVCCSVIALEVWPLSVGYCTDLTLSRPVFFLLWELFLIFYICLHIAALVKYPITYSPFQVQGHLGMSLSSVLT